MTEGKYMTKKDKGLKCTRMGQKKIEGEKRVVGLFHWGEQNLKLEW